MTDRSKLKVHPCRRRHVRGLLCSLRFEEEVARAECEMPPLADFVASAGRRTDPDLFATLAAMGLRTENVLCVEVQGRRCRRRTAGRAPLPEAFPGPDDVPHWDAELRVLTFRGKVVKRFRQRAREQEAILAAFEEEGWPPRIDDPIPPSAELVPKQRLHFTIANLNRYQEQKLITFSGDGTGEGVCWAPVAPAKRSAARGRK